MSFRISLNRVLKYGFINLWRHRLLSLTAILVMFISLTVLAGLLVLNQLADLSSQSIRKRVDISIFFTQDAKSEQITDVGNEIQQFEEVESVKITLAQQALEDFKEKHKDDPLIQKTLSELEINPLDSSLVIVAKNLNQYQFIIQKIERSRFFPLVKEINYEDSRELINRLDRITLGVKNMGTVLAIIFACTTVLVSYNTLKLTIFSRREEIEIMRLVGASNWYIRGPYIVEGVSYGILGALLSLIATYPSLTLFENRITQFFGIAIPANSYFESGFWIMSAILIVSGSVLGALSSLIATRRFLQA